MSWAYFRYCEKCTSLIFHPPFVPRVFINKISGEEKNKRLAFIDFYEISEDVLIK